MYNRINRSFQLALLSLLNTSIDIRSGEPKDRGP